MEGLDLSPLDLRALDLRLVIDIGKTHVKIHLLDADLHTLVEHQRGNSVLTPSSNNDTPYAHFDVDSLWHWLTQTITHLPALYRQRVASLCITTHGAAAALIDRNSETLVLPLLDYESAQLESINSAYEQVRPSFSQSLSPALPLGLNLGRQLFWLQSAFPNDFARATDILLLPQYWAWRFSGVRAAECSSLGCHTDLWNIANADYSSLVDSQGWRALFPPLRKAWDALGSLRPELQTQLGLPAECLVHAGIHDSNASLFRYLQQTNKFALLSTGTWTIAMAVGAPLELLNSERDMLANCDALGRPVACSRFMGGREYAQICAQLDAPLASPQSFDELQAAIDSNSFALPNFSQGSGPFPHQTGRFIGDAKQHAPAVATLYCALMMDLQLDLLSADGDIFMEGSFLQNPKLCAVLAQLRATQTLILSASGNGTVQGCALLANAMDKPQPPLDMNHCVAARLTGLEEYKQEWRAQLL